MTTNQLLCAIAVLTAVFIWTFYQYINSWWHATVADMEVLRAQMEYLKEQNKELEEKNLKMKEDLVRNMGREVGWLNERKLLNSRLKFMAKELTFDDMKKTQVKA